MNDAPLPFGDELPPPQPTGKLFGDMFGLGPLMRLVNDPNLSANAHKAVQAIVDGQASMVRIESKLDLLLRALGHDPGQIGRSAIAALPDGVADRARGLASASVAADDGSGAAAADHGQAVDLVRQPGDSGGDDGGDRRATIAAAFTRRPGVE